MSKGDKMVVDDGVIRSFEKLESDYIRESRYKLRAILQEKLDKNPSLRFVASAEEFSGDPFKAFSNSGWIAQNLFEITKELNLDIKIIVFLRRQDEFMESMYTQSIHLGASHSFEEFLSEYEEGVFDWYRLVESYAQIFGKANVYVKRYHKDFLPENDSLLHQMGEVLGSPLLKQFKGTNPRNRGLSRDALEITRITNNYLIKEDQYLLRNIFQDTNAKQPFESYAYFTQSDRVAFLKPYSESNARIAREYMNIQDELFPVPAPSEEDSDIYPGLTVEALALNLSRGLVTLNKRLTGLERDLRYELKTTSIRYKIKRLIRSMIRK